MPFPDLWGSYRPHKSCLVPLSPLGGRVWTCAVWYVNTCEPRMGIWISREIKTASGQNCSFFHHATHHFACWAWNLLPHLDLLLPEDGAQVSLLRDTLMVPALWTTFFLCPNVASCFLLRYYPRPATCHMYTSHSLVPVLLSYDAVCSSTSFGQGLGWGHREHQRKVCSRDNSG